MITLRMNPPPKKIEGTGHFLRRCEERLANSSNRTKKKFHALYDVMTSGRARTGGLDGKYAIQFGGEPRSRGDYLVVAIRGGHLDGFLSLLVDQYVIEPNTSTIPATRVLPLDQGGTLSNPQPTVDELTTGLRETYISTRRHAMMALSLGDVATALSAYGIFEGYVHFFESQQEGMADSKQKKALLRDAFALADTFRKDLASRLQVKR